MGKNNDGCAKIYSILIGWPRNINPSNNSSCLNPTHLS